jgi:hypothetical protein
MEARARPRTVASMQRWLAGVLVVVVTGLGVQHLLRTEPWIWGARCAWVDDGNAPRWVLEASDYPEGCVYDLPWFLAPPGADWTIYCTMWCEPIYPPRD